MRYRRCSAIFVQKGSGRTIGLAEGRGWLRFREVQVECQDNRSGGACERGLQAPGGGLSSPSSMSLRYRSRRAIFMMPWGSPPSRMSVPLPAMLVAMVTAEAPAPESRLVRGSPAWAMISASLFTLLGSAFSTLACTPLQRNGLVLKGQILSSAAERTSCVSFRCGWKECDWCVGAGFLD